MRRARWYAGVLATAMAATLAPVPAYASTDAAPPDRIELPDGWQPEGISTDGTYLYVGSLADGAIWRARISTGEGEIIAEGSGGRVGTGTVYDRRRDVVWVAGGDTGEIRAQDAVTGEVRAVYDFPSGSGRFVNDLVVTRKGVYATDSLNKELAVIPIDEVGGPLPPASAATTVPLTGELEYGPDFNLNGLDKSRGKLIAVQSNTGLVFRINKESGRARTVDLGGEVLTNGDGLEVDGDTMYVVRNQNNLIVVADLAKGHLSGTVVDELTDPDFDVPTTVALARNSLWAVNARFGTEPTPDTAYWITRVDEPTG